MDMSLMRIGTLGAYMKNMEKAAMWQLKKESGDLTSHKMSLDEWLEQTKTDSFVMTEQMEKQREQDDPDVQTIYYKVQTGKKLSQKEMEYLQQNDPETYAKALSIQQERKAYERELKQCKTQEEVQRLKMTKLGESLSMVNEISNNPNIPLEKKLEYVMMENARVTAITEETEKFVKSGEYEKLPTEAEQNEALEEMREEKLPEEAPEENASADIPEEQAAGEPSRSDAEIEAAEPSRSDESIESDEEKKVKRAKARAAYEAIVQMREITIDEQPTDW